LKGRLPTYLSIQPLLVFLEDSLEWCQVIEHVPRANALSELDRVLKPGGFLILGTPDYAKWQWLVIEWLYKMILPQSYADEHITHYTFRDLNAEFAQRRGYKLEAVRYILKGELILGLRKPLSED